MLGHGGLLSGVAPGRRSGRSVQAITGPWPRHRPGGWGGSGGDEATGLRTWDPENLRAGNYQRTSAPGAYLPLAIFLLSLLLAVSALLAAPVHGVAALLRRAGPGGPPGVPRRVHALPLLAVVSLVAAAVALGIGVSGQDGLLALGHSFLAALACAALVLYLADSGWLGLRTWAY